MTSQTRRSTGWLMASLLTAAALAGAAVSHGPAAVAHAPAAVQPSPLPQVMRLKLDSAQAVLQALVTEDYPALERSANQLGALTKRPEWGVLKTPEYARHSAEFLRETANLAASARAGDLNAAALDYAALTFKCVQCHRHVKGTRAAD
jgi:hypothetical protein